MPVAATSNLVRIFDGWAGDGEDDEADEDDGSLVVLGELTVAWHEAPLGIIMIG